MDEQKYIYAAILSSPFGTGKVIRAATKFLYNHSAISFSPDMHSFYSFARYYKPAPFYSGFIEESVLRYKSEKHQSHIKVFKIPVTEENYAKIKERISSFEENKEDYIYNLVSVLFFLQKKNIKIKNAYTCLEFTSGIVRDFCEIEELKKRSFVSIKDFSEILDPYTVYEGPTEKYFPGADWGTDRFLKKISPWFCIKQTIWNNARLIKRMFEK